MRHDCTFVKCSAFTLSAVIVLMHGLASSLADDLGQPLMVGQGTMIAEVSDHSAIAQTRLTSSDHLTQGDVPGATGAVLFELYEAVEDGTLGIKVDARTATTSPEYDFHARAIFEELKPATRYVVLTKIGPDETSIAKFPSFINRFQTHPGKEDAVPEKFIVISCMNYAKFHGDPRIDRAEHLEENNIDLAPPYAGPDKNLGYPGLATLLKHAPQFICSTGDNVYFDTPEDPRAQTIPELRRKYHEQWVQPRFKDLFAEVPFYWHVDDHDYRIDDGDNTGDHLPSVEDAQKLMREQLPYGKLGDRDVKTYRTFRVNKDLQIWLTENRIYRSPNAMEDGPEKTIWGQEQRAWLQRTLVESDATFKLLITPNPMVGPDDARKFDNHANVGGFEFERDQFFKFVTENGLNKQGFFVICGDRHWQYHSRHPSGVEEFGCGSLVDENARIARPIGDEGSTDPEGTIKRLYSQLKPSGGFLQLELTPSSQGQPASLKFTHFDDEDQVLYDVLRTSPRP